MRETSAASNLKVNDEKERASERLEDRQANGTTVHPAGTFGSYGSTLEHTRFPYALHLKREGTNEHWVDAKDRWGIVYTAFLNGANGSTIRPRHVRRTAREILRKHRKIERSKVENQHGSTIVKAGEYPPNVL